jgi:hypothetical protein
VVGYKEVLGIEGMVYWLRRPSLYDPDKRRREKVKKRAEERRINRGGLFLNFVVKCRM